MDEKNHTGAPSSDEMKKKLKKQAKREARAMQDLEQARRDLQKAEQKQTRAARLVHEQQVALQESEARLEAVRSARRALQAEMESSSEAKVAEAVLLEAVA